MATHSNILAWRIPWTEELGRLQSMGSQRVGHDWTTEHAREHAFAHTHTHTHGIYTAFTCFMTSNTPSIWPWEEYIFCITWVPRFHKSIRWHGRIMLSFSISCYFSLHLGVTERGVRTSPCINVICLLFSANLQACKCLKVHNCHISCQIAPLVIKKRSFSL